MNLRFEDPGVALFDGEEAREDVGDACPGTSITKDPFGSVDPEPSTPTAFFTLFHRCVALESFSGSRLRPWPTSCFCDSRLVRDL